MENLLQNKHGIQGQRMQTLKNISKITFYFLLVTQLFACTQEEKKETASQAFQNVDATENVWRESAILMEGNALGTTFFLKTSDDSLLTSAKEIDSIFTLFNGELSTYIPNSDISIFNDSAHQIDLNKTHYFKDCFELSHQIYHTTDGAFDPTVYPLVSLWGFFKNIDIIPTQEEIDSVLAFSGMKEGVNYTYEEGVLTKLDDRLKLVFNAIAKGQSVDVIADFLEAKGQTNYYVEVGGEIRVKGVNHKGEDWIIGIDEPTESNSGLDGFEQRELENMIRISDKGMATSGNYRDFYVLDGVTYSHTIDPVAGKPIRQSILSATVIAKNTATADAYATAFMVMGVEKSLALIKAHPEYEIEAYLLYLDNGRIKRAYSKGMTEFLVDQ